MKTELSGCKPENVDASECARWLEWLLGQRAVPPRPTTSCWLLAHCDDGVTWGLRNNGTWQLGSSAFPDLCPQVSLDNLIELRLFGDQEELLMWRGDSGLCGRWLIDTSGSECDASLRPHSEDRVLLGHRHRGFETRNGFTRVGDGSGREQAVPLVCSAGDFGTEQPPRMPLRLTVKHYFETDSQTGAVRVAASRLMTVRNDADNKGARQ